MKPKIIFIKPHNITFIFFLLFSFPSFAINSGLSAEFNLSDLDGNNGFVINGVNQVDGAGTSVSYAGDINGDGVDDLIIGAPGVSSVVTDTVGYSYVVFGQESGFNSPFELSSLNGNNGFVINGIERNDFTGYSVSHAGDVNGDGLDDLIIGAFAADPNNITSAGRSYVVFGQHGGFPNPFELSTLNGNNGFVINGVGEFDLFGQSVSYAGDVNGDGLDDLIIGAPGADFNGKDAIGVSYVMFGQDAGFNSPFELSSLNGNNGFAIIGVNAGDKSGFSVSQAGDMNGDGLNDLVIGAPAAFGNGHFHAGTSYVVFGQDGGFSNPLELSTLNGINGFVINGVNGLDTSGNSVSNVGDINGDEFDDLIIGAPQADSNGIFQTGISYVVFGQEDKYTSPLELSSIDGNNGFVINGVNENDETGYSVSHAGDVNGDGVADLVIGAFASDPNDNLSAGSSYVVYGQNNSFPNPLNLPILNGNNGFVIHGVNEEDFSGTSVSHAGDVNGDGLDDLIIGASWADPNGNSRAGSSYVVFGQSNNNSATQVPIGNLILYLFLAFAMLLVFIKHLQKNKDK